MRKIHKMLLFIVALAGLTLSAASLGAFYPVPYVTDALDTLTPYYPWLYDVLAGYCVFICVCFSVLALAAVFMPGRTDQMLIITPKGRLQISKHTIESTIRRSFAEVENINFCKIRVKLHSQPEKTKIFIRLSLSDSSQIVELTHTIQGNIETALQTSLGIEIKAINIKIDEYNPSGAPAPEQAEPSPEERRVV